MDLSNHARKERRYSERWFSGKEIDWRVHGGSRVRRGRVRERSLNGMVLAVAAGDAVAPGVFVYPTDAQSALRHGFKNAVICRSIELGHKERLLFAEILA